MERRQVYIAGPEVFLPIAQEIGERKKKLCEKYGFIGLFPLDNEIENRPNNEDKASAIYGANIGLINQADLLIANLTPFRGPGADVGTVFELGMMVGLGKPVFGYTNDATTLLERVRQYDPAAHRSSDQTRWVDGNGMAIEDFGCADNLMIDICLRFPGSDGIIPRKVRAPDKYKDLGGFEACLKRARDYFVKSDVYVSDPANRQVAARIKWKT